MRGCAGGSGNAPSDVPPHDPRPALLLSSSFFLSFFSLFLSLSFSLSFFLSSLSPCFCLSVSLSFCLCLSIFLNVFISFFLCPPFFSSFLPSFLPISSPSPFFPLFPPRVPQALTLTHPQRAEIFAARVAKSPRLTVSFWGAWVVVFFLFLFPQQGTGV